MQSGLWCSLGYVQSGLCCSLVYVHSGLCAVWVLLQSWICYSMGYVTSIGYVTVWEVFSLGNTLSGICYSLGYVTVWVMSSLGRISLCYVVVCVMLQSGISLVCVKSSLG